MASNLYEALFEGVISAVFNDKPKSPKVDAEKVDGKIDSTKFDFDENKIYHGIARDVPWTSKSMDLKYKCIISRLEELKESGHHEETIDSIIRQIKDYNRQMMKGLTSEAKKEYGKMSGYYNDYNLLRY